MIIAWYPGACGNRFYKWVNGQTEFEQNKVYDRLNPYQIQVNRYPSVENKLKLIQRPIVFTHCVNHTLINDCWPGHDEIYFIEADKNKSLRRQWSLEQRLISNNQHPVGGPFSTIVWHDEYYTKYPWQPGPGTVVNENNFLEFSTMLQQELDSIVCPEFDFAQEMFDKHGALAPILDLYNQYYDRK
jgi:hypothetical protein